VAAAVGYCAVGLDYRYLLFFERDACFDVLVRLAEMAVLGNDDDPTTLALPDRTVTLPFSGWLHAGPRLTPDDPRPTWDFRTFLCFEPDEEIEDYLERLSSQWGEEAAAQHQHEELGRPAIGYIYLSVHRDMTEWPSGTGDDLVLFEFGTTGSRMSALFFASESIRRTFTGLLESCRGVYGLFDMENRAELFWLRGVEQSVQLPTAEMPLAEIERPTVR
jgi:hypothetical protein